MRMFVLCLLILSLASCAKKSEQSFREESRAQIRSLVKILEKVENVEDLVRQQNQLRNSFLNIAELMIEVRKYQVATQKKWDIEEEDKKLSEDLRHELSRILRLQGAHILMEKCQNDALLRLQHMKNS